MLLAATAIAAADQPDAPLQVAAAQSADATPPTPAPDVAAATPPAAPQVGMQNLDTVVVTAQKRKERLQDVPLAVTVVNEKQMRAQNITQVNDLSRAVPSIETNGEPGNPDTRISIRGISTNSFSVTAEQAVSYVADGVVLGKAPTVNLFDVSRIEVLRGPQGTLFGKNASGGVINVTTNAPDPDKFEAIVHADQGFRYDRKLMQAAVNIPITGTAALRVSAGQSREGGLIHNALTGDPSSAWVNGARARLQWEPTPYLSFNTIGDFEKSFTSQQMYLIFSRYIDESTGQAKPIPGCDGTLASYYARVSCNNNPTYNKSGSWGLSQQIDLRVGKSFNITSITAGRRYIQNGRIDVDGVPGNYYDNGNSFDNKVLSQELRIASIGKQRLEYTAGFYYSKSNVPNFLSQTIGDDMLAALGVPILPVSPCTALNLCLGDTVALYNPNQYTARLRSAALFGQVTWHVTDKWRFIGGLRATRDNVDMTSTSFLGVNTNVLPFLQLLSPVTAPLFQAASQAVIPLNAPLNGAEEVKNISWRGGLQYDFTRHLMAYATASRGYKGPQIVFNPPGIIPGINLNGGGAPVTLPAPASISVVNPEYPMDYEAGVKATVLHGAFAVDFNLFHTTIKDFQSQSMNKDGLFVPNNIPHVITQGAELDLLGFLGPGLTLNGGFMYDRATYPKGYLTACTQVSARCANTSNATEDVGGTQLIAAPKFKFTLTPAYTGDIYPWLSGFISADMVYKTDIRFQPSTDTRDHTGNHFVLGFRMGVKNPDDKWSVALFGRNILNAYNPSYLFAPYLFSGAASPGVDTTGQAISTESFPFFGLSIDGHF
jgi:iron complex outermembrane receptor protein